MTNDPNNPCDFQSLNLLTLTLTLNALTLTLDPNPIYNNVNMLTLTTNPA